VPAMRVVHALQIVEDRRPRLRARPEDRRSSDSHSRVAKTDSMIALGWAFNYT